jgi:hypothetical protein
MKVIINEYISKKIKCSNPVGLRPEKDCAGDAQQKLKTIEPTFRQKRRPHQQIRNCLKIIKERRKKIGCGSQMGAWHRERLVDLPSVVIWLWLHFDFDFDFTLTLTLTLTYSVPDEVIEFFSLPKPSSCAMALGFDSASNRIEFLKIFLWE